MISVVQHPSESATTTLFKYGRNLLYKTVPEVNQNLLLVDGLFAAVTRCDIMPVCGFISSKSKIHVSGGQSCTLTLVASPYTQKVCNRLHSQDVGISKGISSEISFSVPSGKSS